MKAGNHDEVVEQIKTLMLKGTVPQCSYCMWMKMMPHAGASDCMIVLVIPLYCVKKFAAISYCMWAWFCGHAIAAVWAPTLKGNN